MVPVPASGEDVFIKDPRTGALALASANGEAGNGFSDGPDVTGGGAAAFASAASDLVAGNANGARDVFIWD